MLASELLAARAAFISPGVVAIDEPGYPFPEGFLVPDPDGHLLQVMQAVTDNSAPVCLVELYFVYC